MKLRIKIEGASPVKIVQLATSERPAEIEVDVEQLLREVRKQGGAEKRWDSYGEVEVTTELAGAKIERIEQRTGAAVCLQYRDEYCPYDIRVITDKGVIIIAGAHDTGGDAIIVDRRNYDLGLDFQTKES